MARLTTTLALIVLLLPAAASARLRTIAPPGDSAVSQYVESVPTAKGKSPTSSLGDQPGALTPSQSQALDRAGPDGRTLAAVVDATSPPASGAHRSGSHEASSGSGAGGTFPSGAISGKGARSPVSSVLAAATGSGGGMGLLLPVLMAAAALGVAVLALLRRRRTPPPS